MKRRLPSRHPAFGFLAIACSLAVATAVLSACGKEDSTGGTGANASVSTKIPASGCGAIRLSSPADPDGVLETLPESTQKNYLGFPRTVRKSPWSDFKPDHGPPYTVGLAFANLTTPSQSVMYSTLKKAFGNDPNMRLRATSTGSELNIPLQQQAFTQLAGTKPDLMIVEPLTDAFGSRIESAAKNGIPTLSILANSTGSDSAITMMGNTYGNQAVASSVVFRQMGGKGNVVFVHGIASTAVDHDAYSGYNEVKKSCPGVKEIGQIAGAYSAPTAKAEMLKFLATHPQRIDGVVQASGMASGIIDAFKQAGRPVPIVADTGALKGSLGYWRNTPDYNGFGLGFPPASFGNAIYQVARRMLDGQGLRVSEVISMSPAITDANLNQWAQKDWNLRTSGIAEGPPQQYFPDKYIKTLFANPSEN